MGPLFLWGALAALAGPAGERPSVETHLDQRSIESGAVDTETTLKHGEMLFNARFNRLDGQGRPATTGHGAQRPSTQPLFIRTSGPDANSCAGCHFQPRVGGAGDFVANVFVLAQERDPVVETIDSMSGNERGSPSLMGTGLIELLAREMSRDLAAARTEAREQAKSTGKPARRALVSKGVFFGAVTVTPEGRVDPSEIDGVDWDLVVRPFHQKGAVASIRDFTNTALNHHHGVQTSERFGATNDLDKDGMRNELTVGDVTALVFFQAALDTPGRMMPADPARRALAVRGEKLFETIGCSSCHTPALVLNDPVFVEPGPFNPQGNLRVDQGPKPVSIDLSVHGIGPRPERDQAGRIVVRAFTDLKRHELNDRDFTHFANEKLHQGTLAGVQQSAAFTAVPRARPPTQFLTKRLWDAGNTDPYGHRGDLTLLTDAIHFHGGEARAARDAFFSQPEADRAAVIEFLKTLQILPEGATSQVMQDPSSARDSARAQPRDAPAGR